MHNIDRTYMEVAWETDPVREYETAYEDEYANEAEVGAEYESAYAGEAMGEYAAEGEYEEEYEDEYESYASMTGEMVGETTSLFNEAEELELAAELLEVTDEAELEEFLGKLFNKAKEKLQQSPKSGVWRTLGKGLKGLASKALPIAGRAVGSIFGGPVGGMIGGKLAAGAGKLFGLEMEGLSLEDQEFEVARRYVQLAGEATKEAILNSEDAPAQVIAKKAVAKAVKKLAPGLIPAKPPVHHPMPHPMPHPVPHLVPASIIRHAGQWQRQGKHLLLYNVYP